MGQKKNRKQAAKDLNRQRIRELNRLAGKLRNGDNTEPSHSLITENRQVRYVSTFEDFAALPFAGEMNAVCWNRELTGDFEEIVNKVEFDGNMTTLEEENLLELDLSEQGQLARQILMDDLKRMESLGASPVLNVIRHYERDEDSFFPTDVYSFHVDRSPIPVDTILCTYYGDSSEIVPNSRVQQKILVPEIRNELRKLYEGPEEGFEAFLTEHFFDLHYQAEPDAEIINLGIGHIWKLATDHPDNRSLPCVHRAPVEKPGRSRLLLIC